jgi:tetratricopeptide (TPR) repeat protein
VVDRAYGGNVVHGRYVEPEAYAAFLRGAMAQASGDLREALAAYGDASRLDPESAEIWTRIAEVRCQMAPRDAGAQRALAHALELEPSYARAWAVHAKCAMARGDDASARAAAERAAALDPSADAANVVLARSSGSGAEAQAATRQRLVALTSTASEPLVAWEALASWAEAHGDIPLWSRALRETAVIAPGKRQSVAAAAEELAGIGALAEARAVAAAAIEVDERPFDGGGHELAARLALDDAIARGDLAAVRRRATRARIPLDEAAGRALLAGALAMARSLATAAAEGDPTARGARLVLAAVRGDNVVQAALDARGGDAPVSAAALVAFGRLLSHRASPEPSWAALAATPHAPLVAGDERVVRPAVDLVARGVLSASVLPPDGAIELSAVRGEAPVEPLPRLDARHEYLALALLHSGAKRIHELADRLAVTAPSDTVVVAATCLVGMARGTPPPAAGSANALLAHDPADPLLAAVALRLAEKVGDTDAARRARAALAALHYSASSLQ